MKSYYGELCTKVYESGKSLAEGKELEFYLSFVTRPDMEVLEPMCGNGRLLIPFMQRGIGIEGFDISEDMLKMCREKGRSLGLEPRVDQAKLEEFVSDKNFDLIVIPFGSFSLLPDELVDQGLRQLKKALSDQGKLLLTIMVEPHQGEDLAEWTESGMTQLANESIRLYKKTRYDAEKVVLFTELKYELVKDDRVLRTEIMEFPVRFYGIDAFKQILERNDFRQVTVHEVENGYGEGTLFHVFECG
ncbi:class I SAM-dependent methyltransferase [Saccharibacillus sacchari]|uniref:class I SAM-dependent methyltransferase n=1 Tax=Saccharibacillus sacchari TaxID=456493 RepID=UPI0004BAE794|nr:class I SAM-dependent methyltransferase [Saccharibacillus sacchari]